MPETEKTRRNFLRNNTSCYDKKTLSTLQFNGINLAFTLKKSLFFSFIQVMSFKQRSKFLVCFFVASHWRWFSPGEKFKLPSIFCPEPSQKNVIAFFTLCHFSLFLTTGERDFLHQWIVCVCVWMFTLMNLITLTE